MLINKKKRTCHLVHFAVLEKLRGKMQKWKDWQILGNCLRAEKVVEYVCDDDTNNS